MHFHMEMRGQADTEGKRERERRKEGRVRKFSSSAGLTAGKQTGGGKAAERTAKEKEKMLWWEIKKNYHLFISFRKNILCVLLAFCSLPPCFLYLGSFAFFLRCIIVLYIILCYCISFYFFKLLYL